MQKNKHDSGEKRERRRRFRPPRSPEGMVVFAVAPMTGTGAH